MGLPDSATLRSMGMRRAPRNQPAAAASHATEPSTMSEGSDGRGASSSRPARLPYDGPRVLDATGHFEGLGVFS